MFISYENVDLPLCTQNGYIIYDSYFYSEFYKKELSSIRILKELEGYDIILWMNPNGKISYRLNSQINLISIQKLSLFLSNILGRDIFVVTSYRENERIIEQLKNKPTYNSLGEPGLQIDLSVLRVYELPIIQYYIFNPFNKNKMIYKTQKDNLGKIKIKNLALYNNFIPTNYLNPRNPAGYGFSIRHSITMQFLFFLCKYNEGCFRYLISWIAYLFQSIREEKEYEIPPFLVLIGEKKYKEIFWNILKEIFGWNYCLEITDDFLEKNLNSYKQPISNTIILNLNIISNYTDDKEKNEILLYFLSKIGFLRIIMLDSTEKTFDFSDEYFAINISEKPFEIYDHKTKSNIVYSYKDLEDGINSDLNNFCAYLLALKIGKNLLFNADNNLKLNKKYTLTLGDKIKIFSDIIVNKKITKLDIVERENYALYNEVKTDFETGIVKQKNLIKLFDILYKNTKISGNSRGLMKALREFNHDFFSSSEILSKSKIGKYFKVT